ncbi:hypothetical protein N9M61_01265 [Gammaproteobacteria bacterium]|nr:hypothetical protein [Gammaproteobacteria bacterium]MDC0919632.1 hypothetical protein [Gammaproteobacteria bacterium]
MKNIFFSIVIPALFLFSFNSFSSSLILDECSASDVKYDEPNYAETEEERIIRMDQQLEALLNSFEECVAATDASFSATTSQSNNSSSSSATNSASGNEIIPNKKEESSNIPAVKGDTNNINSPDNIDQGDNGSTPKDIPDIATDDTTARQLRAVAEGEKDPLLKEIYWDEYRKYKGIKSPD